ncbi:glycoside hydrolase family 13 protein [Arthrobacter cavernae]|nr:glycoside hydrolase family 13 protein [Arthrobacter cavernae]
MPEATKSPLPWWHDAVIYQVYPRSFADGNGDGMGDLPGITSRLGHLKELGVDAVWLSPFYSSPQADAGYDVSDYRQVDELFGTLADFDALRDRAHGLGLKVIVDLVPNHTSDQHVWFQEALAAAPGSEARERYMFRPGKDAVPGSGDGTVPPNDWNSLFGGPAWTRITEADGTPGEWYLHLFAAAQPDLNWENPVVRAEFEDVLRFWLDRGVDGFRVDVAHGMVKAEGLPDWSAHVAMVEGTKKRAKEKVPPPPPYFDQDGVHEIYRSWNRLLAGYDGDRVLVAEAWVEPASRLARYIRQDEMQQAFNFGYMCSGWDAEKLGGSIKSSLQAVAEVDRPCTWVLSNHDSVRHPSRFGLSDPTTYPHGISSKDEQPNEALGLARARAATMITMALPGSAYIYQGEELGLPEHTTLAARFRQDPSFIRTKGQETGRDGCRIPLPWAKDEPNFGFSAVPDDGEPAAPWLPQPSKYGRYAADQQSGVEHSTLELYRALLAERRARSLGTGTLRWPRIHKPKAGILAFENSGVLVIANMSEAPVELPRGYRVLLRSQAAAVSHGRVKPNRAVWLVAGQGGA